jgi:hypothetical protein
VLLTRHIACCSIPPCILLALHPIRVAHHLSQIVRVHVWWEKEWEGARRRGKRYAKGAVWWARRREHPARAFADWRRVVARCLPGRLGRTLTAASPSRAALTAAFIIISDRVPSSLPGNFRAMRTPTQCEDSDERKYCSRNELCPEST